MKIGFDAKRANRNFTGLGNYSRFVIEAMARYEAENEYQLYLPKYRSNREYDALRETYPAIKQFEPSQGLFRGALSSLWRTLFMRGDLERNGVDIYHGLSNEIPLGLASSSVRTVVTIHDLIFRRLPRCYKPIDRWIYDLKFKYACRRADRVIAVSECTKRDIVELYGIASERVDVIYQGCAPHFSVDALEAARAAEVRAKYQLPERFILNVGTLEERKNLLLVVKALERLPEEVHLVACGRSTKYMDGVMEYAEERGLTERIHIINGCGYFDLPYMYHLAEVSIYPSRYEGFGIPIIESLSCGTPVVAAMGSCLEEAGGDAAAYVDADDAEGCAKEILRFMDDAEYRAAAVARGLKYVERFSKERIAADIARLYNEMME